MFDKNRREIKTGDIVEITGAYFKNDNGLYFVDRSPGDPGWSGKDHCLKKICKNGRISAAKYGTCFWPILVFVSDQSKRRAANEWNAGNAEIEIKTIANMEAVEAHFRAEAEDAGRSAKVYAWNYGEDHEYVKDFRERQSYFLAVADRIKG